MIKYIPILLLLSSLPLRAATINAASSSRTDVNAAISSAAPGDTVVVPAGTSSWSGDVTISGITLQGPGKDASSPTTITAGKVNINKHTTQITRLIGFRFTGDNQHFDINGSWTAKPFVVHDCYFYINNGYLGKAGANGGLFSSCDFIRQSLGGGNAIHATLDATPAANTSWSSADSIGNADVNGDKNIYFEDCVIQKFRDGFPDVDNGARVVIRYCTINDSSIITHGGGSPGGNDTSTYGARHLEIYNNDFNRVATGPNDPLNQWVWFRGSSGIIANNEMDEASTQQYGGKPEVRLSVGCPGSYPMQYQVGQSTQARDSTPDKPILIFGNTGYGVRNLSIEGNPNNSCGNAGSYIKQNRDYALNNSWGWVPYTYPHPLRSGTVPTPDTQAPTVPTGVAAAASSGQINLTWNSSSDNIGVAGYEIYRNGAGSPLTSVTGTSFSDVSVNANTTYSYQVVAFDAAGNKSAKSTSVSATTPAPDSQPPTVPSGLSSTAMSSSQISLNWNGSSDNVGVAGYEIYRNGGTTPMATVSGTSYMDGGLSPNTTYSYQALAYDASGNKSAKSSSVSATTQGASQSGTTYYVDQTAGSDSRNGTSPATAWKNCPGMESYTGSGTLQAGDTVYFDRGDTWLVSGSHGIYLTGGVTYIGNSWGTGTKAHLQASANIDTGVVRFRDHATVPTVFEGFNVDANGKVANGVDINTAYWQLMNGAMKRVKDCEVHHTWSRTSQNQYRYGVIISNHGGTGGYAENVEIINCVVHDTSRDALCLYPGDENKDCRIKNITVRGCEVYNTGQDPDYGAGAGILVKGYVVDAVIEHNYVHDTQGALLFVNGNESRHFGVGPTNIHVRYNIFDGATGQGGAILIYDGSSGKDPKDLKIYGNIVYNSTSLGGFWLDSGLGNTLSLRMYNNTFYNAPVWINNNSATVTVFEFKNNIVYSAGSVPLTDSAGKISAHSNNLYYRGSGTLVNSGGTSYNANALSNYESGASSANPSFKNTGSLPTGFTGTYGVDLAPNSDGLSLQAGSAGIDNGTALATGYQSSINSVVRPAGAGWDRGAYEYLTLLGQAPDPPTNLRRISN